MAGFLGGRNDDSAVLSWKRSKTPSTAAISSRSKGKSMSDKSNKMTASSCKFGVVQERDMDLLFLEAIASDHDFAKMFVDEAGYPNRDFHIQNVELSRTEAGLGESDITVKVDVDGKTLGLLIENKIDAEAQEDQHARYLKRGDKGIENGEYDSYEVFIVSPKSYHESNSEAVKYEHFISYEACKDYYEKQETLIGQIRSQQISQALEHARTRSETYRDECAIAFNEQYHEYQAKHYPSLRSQTKASSNGWWQYFKTNHSNVSIRHKVELGSVDILFGEKATELSSIQRVASWLKNHGYPDIIADTAGKSGSLTIAVPPLNIRERIKNIPIEELDECFRTIQQLADMECFFEDVQKIMDTNN